MVKIRNAGFEYHMIYRMKVPRHFFPVGTKSHDANIFQITVRLAVSVGDDHFLKYDPYVSFMIERKILWQIGEMISLSIQCLAFIVSPLGENRKCIFSHI